MAVTASNATSDFEPSDPHKPKGCNLVHPFVLDPEVDWSKERDAFSKVTWEYTESKVRHTELRRLQYSNLVGLVIPIQYAFASLFYPFFFYSGEWDGYIYAFFIFGIAWMVLLPLGIYAQMKKSHEYSWIKLKMAIDVISLLHVNLGTYFDFRNLYGNCQIRDDDTISTMIGRDMSNTTGYGWTPERNSIYCQQIVHPSVAFCIIVIPLTVNLPPFVVLACVAARVIHELLNRPIAVAQGIYDPAEPAAALTSHIFVLIFSAVYGIIIYAKLQTSGIGHFTQAVGLAVETQEAKEKEEHLDLLLSATVPPSALVRLANNEICNDFTQTASVLFSDMVHFTAWSSARPAKEVVRMLNLVTESIDKEAVRLGVEKIKTIGDAYWAVAGLPEQALENTANLMCEFGKQMLVCVHSISRKHREWGEIQFRIGIHTGPLSGGILGNQMISYEVYGETSDVASKVEQNGLPSRVVITVEVAEEADLNQEELTQHSSFEHNGVTYNMLTFNKEFDTAAQGSRYSSHSRSVVSAKSRAHTRKSQEGVAGRNRRKAFLQQRAIAQSKKAMHSMELSFASMDESDVRDRFSKLKWRYLLSTLADEQAEAEYKTFALEKTKEMRFLNRVFLLSMPLLILFATAIEQSVPGAPVLSAGSIILFLLSMISGLVDVVLLRKLQKEIPILHLVNNFVTVILCLIGSMVSTPGSSITTNDASWQLPVFQVAIMLGNAGVIATLWLTLLNLYFLWPFMFICTWHTYNYGEHRTMEAQVFVAAGFLMALYERHLRQQFADYKLQQHYTKEQQNRVAEQHALLRSIVPDHISGALLTWMSGEMRDPLVRNYSKCAVAFMHLQPPRKEVPKIPSVTQKSAFGEAIPACPDPDEGLACVGVKETAIEEKHWQSESIAMVDDLLAAKTHISKIKTIGDVVMLAGPFLHEPAGKKGDDAEEFQSYQDMSTTDDDVEKAVVDLIELSQLLEHVGGGVWTGIHCGPLVGAIQGTNRLCFDVFGDTVNVASRCMTGGAKARKESLPSYASSSFCIVSNEAKEAMKGVGNRFEYEEMTVAAKGKGSLTVHRVSKCS